MNNEIQTQEVTEEEIKEAISEKDAINKRIDFDVRTMRRLETMMPLYSHEIGKCTQSELLSYVVSKAVNNLFDTDFKKKLEEL